MRKEGGREPFDGGLLGNADARGAPSLDCARKCDLLVAVSTRKPLSSLSANCLSALAVVFLLCGTPMGFGAGVTVITHGYEGNVTEWVIPMGDKIPQDRSFPGSNSASYQISITRSGGAFSISQTFLDGVSPLASDSGEIVIALDWSSLSGLFEASTSQIAANAALALLSTNLIPDLAQNPRSRR